MSTPDDIRPATILGAIRSGLLAEMTKPPIDRDIVTPRHIMWMLIASLGEVIDQVEVLSDGAEAADRLIQELAIARAEIGRLELRLEARDFARSPYQPMDRGRVERLHRRGEVVDLSEAFRRERASQPGPAPEGGAA